ncbi:MAG: RidA family protein [Acetobacteraceae bacterium]|nr:RidA family protein [Acetobacteraceae bacterium]MSP30042.1 RidA family protein [Acetobacteraceae bacterium]
MGANARIAELGLLLLPPKPASNYVPFRLAGNMLFLSDVGPRHADGTLTTGKVGAAPNTVQPYQAARQCGLNLLVNMRSSAGSLDRVDVILKVFGMVNAVPDFHEHPKVINGCTDLFTDIFGDHGRPARSAVGMGSLPDDISVGIEAIVLLKG